MSDGVTDSAGGGGRLMKVGVEVLLEDDMLYELSDAV
jgi:hypothetical protein